MLINLILVLLGLYAAIGLAVGIALALVGIGRIDPAAIESPWYFRLVVLPGLAGLWPVMLVMWARGGKGGDA